MRGVWLLLLRGHVTNLGMMLVLMVLLLMIALDVFVGISNSQK